MKSNPDKNQAKLPWWVELLFVQIGLPDSWLSKYLKKKKDAANFINENKKYIAYTAILISGILYIYPIVRYTCLLYTSPSPRDRQKSRMPSSA